MHGPCGMLFEGCCCYGALLSIIFVVVVVGRHDLLLFSLAYVIG